DGIRDKLVTGVQTCALPISRYVGGGGRLTSNDSAEFLYPDLFQSVGTIGHEMMSATQSLDRPLGEAEYEMMDRFVRSMGTASLQIGRASCRERGESWVGGGG